MMKVPALIGAEACTLSFSLSRLRDMIILYCFLINVGKRLAFQPKLTPDSYDSVSL
jgi:hypothetical protein